MNRRSRAEQETPRMFQVMREDFSKTASFLRMAATRFVAWTFATTRAGGRNRRWLVIGLNAFLWAWFAERAHPISFGEEPLNDLLVYPFAALFAADILRHVIVVCLIFWLSVKLAASYLDDVFELGDVSVAEKYILQAVFASDYTRINIRDGGVAKEDRNSPVARIGGPGLVKVHLENAALFEKADGTPRVIGPSETPAVLDRFERLRAVIDLRDQVVDLTVRARTKDGIHVTAKGARMVYSILRGNKEPTLKRPHPFDQEAVKQLVYGQAISRAKGSSADESVSDFQPRARYSVVEMRPFIQAQLKDFISQNSLGEFLANIHEPEIEKRLRQQETLEMEVKNLSLDAQESEDGEEQEDAAPTVPEPFIPRDKITELCYEAINANAQERGFQLKWIDIGTWVLPDEVIPKQHLEAWHLSLQNMVKGSEQELKKIRRASHTSELTRLYQEVPLHTFYELRVNGEKPGKIMHEMALAYREKLRNAWDYYRERGEKPPEELDLAVRYLGWLTSRRVGETRNAQ